MLILLMVSLIQDSETFDWIFVKPMLRIMDLIIIFPRLISLLHFNEITGRQSSGFCNWIVDGNYQIYTDIKPASFTLDISSVSKSSLLKAFAFDCNRMAAASFESMQLIGKNELLPKSTAWLVIQSYYSAFFAAHSIFFLA